MTDRSKIYPIGQDRILFYQNSIYERKISMARTIKELSKKDGRVYVYLANVAIGEHFMQQAEEEGFIFANGAKPTERCFAEIMAVNDNMTINFVGSVGRIAFGSGAETVNGKTLIRVDFEKYIKGAENYEYKR